MIFFHFFKIADCLNTIDRDFPLGKTIFQAILALSKNLNIVKETNSAYYIGLNWLENKVSYYLKSYFLFQSFSFKYEISIAVVQCP